MKNFGTWLKEKRLSLGMRQEDLARLTGTTKQNISRLEKGKPLAKDGTPPLPSPELYSTLAEALGLPTTEVMKAAGIIADDEHKDSGALRLLSYYRDLPDDAKAYLEIFADALWRKFRQDRRRDRAA